MLEHIIKFVLVLLGLGFLTSIGLETLSGIIVLILIWKAVESK